MGRSNMLPLMTLSVHHWTWTRNPDRSLRGVCDESDLPECYSSRVYKDAADHGFLVAGKTGTRLYVYTRDIKNNEGEHIARVFTDAERPNDEIHVIND